MQTTTYRIRGFDGLRAVAVILVWLQHRTSLTSINIGAYGVWLFFVMSGFLIIDILLRQRLLVEGGATSPLAQWREFVFRRTLRIFPIYYLSLIVVLPALYVLHLNHVDALAVVMNIFYLSNVWIGQVLKSWPNNLSHLWSLSIEEQFYLLMPLIALSISSRRLIWACAGAVATALLTKWLLHRTGTEQIAVFTNSVVNFGMIAYGGCCVLLEKRSPPRPNTRSWIALCLLVIYLMLPFVWSAARFDPNDFELTQFAPVLVGPLLLSLYRNQKSTIVSFLELWPLRSLGRISYGFYIYHEFVKTSYLEKILSHALGTAIVFTSPIGLALNFLLPLGAAIFSWHFIEQPILKLRRPRRAGPTELPTGENISQGAISIDDGSLIAQPVGSIAELSAPS